jgi:hypothetical protein
MKYLKTLGPGSVVAIALLAFAGIAQATTLTSPAGTQMKEGEFVNGELVGSASLHGAFVTIKCGKASGEGIITNAGSSTTTVKGEIFLGTFSECNYPVTVLSTGTTEVHTVGASANGNGTLTSSGAKVKLETSVGTCVFTTNGTHLGEVVGGSPARLKILTAKIPRTEGNFLCGSSGTLTAELVATSPSTVLVD